MRDQGLTQKQVAEEMGCSQNRISEIENIDNYDNVIITDTTTERQGNSQEYLLRRIKTSAPDIIPEIGKGRKYPSARAAAIAAGIVKPKISFQVSPDESGASIASKLYPVFCLMP